MMIRTLKSCVIAIVVFALVGLVCTAVLAQPKISIEKKGTYILWVTYKDAKGAEQSTAPQRFKGKETEIDSKLLPAKSTDVKIYVMDKRTGNLAVSDYVPPADPKKAKAVELTLEGFSYVATVRLKVIAEDGAPVESAALKLIDGEGTTLREIITPADGGVAVFHYVATGDVEVKVATKGLKKTINSEFEIPEKRDTIGFEHDIKVSGDVATLPPTAADRAKSGKATKEPQSAGAGLVQTLVGFVFLALVIGIVYVVVRSKGITAESALKKMGMQTPDDQQVSDAGVAGVPAIDPNKCQFCGQMKDGQGNCACSLAAGGSPFAPQTHGPSGPRLIGSQGSYTGTSFEIKGGSAVIGREATNDIGLPNDTTVSRKHATVIASNGSFSIRDEGSSNGTFVNGARITEQKLTPGDEVQVGATKFRFEA